MTITEMHPNLRIEIDKTNSLDSIGFEAEELDYWLNSATRSFVKTRYKGSGSGEAFEQNQKRIDDLRTLVDEEDLSVTRGTENYDKPNSYKASLSSLSDKYWFASSEEVDIVYQSGTTTVISGSLTVGSIYLVSGTGIVTHGTQTPLVTGDYFKATNKYWTSDDYTNEVFLCTSVRQGVCETTSDTYRQEIDNPYSEHVFENNKAKPLRLFKNTDVELITDGDYGVFAYYIRYIKKPQTLNSVTTTGVTSGNIKAYYRYQAISNDVVYNNITYSAGDYFLGVPNITTFTGTGAVNLVITSSDLSEHTHDEIVKLAANMILENIKSPRYQTHTREVNRTE
jgi:hypothetical protein